MDQQGEPGSGVVQSGARCPFCGVPAAEHDAGPCLDRWIHEGFFSEVLTHGQEPPPYSAWPQQPCLEALIEAPRWPQGGDADFCRLHHRQACDSRRSPRGLRVLSRHCDCGYVSVGRLSRGADLLAVTWDHASPDHLSARARQRGS
jgi:hypothetical protein